MARDRAARSRRQLVRASLTLAGLGLLAGCGIPLAPAARSARLHRIGCLLPGTPAQSAPNLEAFRRGLHEHGLAEGQNVALLLRYWEGRAERLPELADELVRSNVDVILTSGNAAISALGRATTTIPIVFAVGGVASGLVASLARPGGNVTGLTNSAGDEAAKRLDLLRQTVPTLSRVAVLSSQATLSQLALTEAAAQALGLQVLPLRLDSPDDLDGVQAAILAGGVDGLVLVTGASSLTYVPRVAAFAATNRLPTISQEQGFARAGGLMEYGPNITENYRRAAAYVDRILKGASPADLPVERPTRYDFIINLETAQAVGLTIPQPVLQQATEVIQ
jgi:putative tryptophan/tyrosine transport system substrate-binding protein